MTFEQYLEGRRSFVTRDPGYDINLAGDYSDDHQDSSHFLVPFLKKIKAFSWWCRVAANEFAANPWAPRISRDRDYYRYGSRVAGLHHGVLGGFKGIGNDDDDTDRGFDSLNDVAKHLQTLHDILKNVNKNRGIYNIGTVLKGVLDLIDTSEETLSRNDHPVAKRIINRLQRIRSFLNASRDQLLRVVNFDSSGGTKTDYFGKRRDS